MPDPTWTPTAHPQADPLGLALHGIRFSDAVCCRSELTAPWGMSIPAPDDTVTFTTVVRGHCLLKVPGQPERTLRPGQLTAIGPCTAYTMRSARSVRQLIDWSEVETAAYLGDRYQHFRYDGGGEETVLFCGIVRPEQPLATRLVRAMPPAIHIDGWESPHSDLLRSAMGLMVHEATHIKPGGAAAVTRLADLLVLQALRAWLASPEVDHANSNPHQNQPQPYTWLDALRDPRLGHAIAAIHTTPQQPWTVETLAEHAGVSRSAFAAEFTAKLGDSPMQYLTAWRMTVATDLLEQNELAIAEIARRVGYASETAFARAFKRRFGLTPGTARDQAHAAHANHD
ncbi:MAG: AraC family transcriptional regulator [Planctomycetota bacterium]